MISSCTCMETPVVHGTVLTGVLLNLFLGKLNIYLHLLPFLKTETVKSFLAKDNDLPTIKFLIEDALNPKISMFLVSSYIFLFAQSIEASPDSKVHGANMGPTWVLSAADGPHVGPMNLAIREVLSQEGWCSWSSACPTTSEWSTISLPTKVHFILEVWQCLTWLLLMCWHQEPGHLQPWYWLCYPEIFTFQHKDV